MAPVARAGKRSKVSASANPNPCATLNFGVASSTVSPGGTVTVSGSIASCSTQTEKVNVTYVVTGPNNFSDTYSLKFMLACGQTRTDSVSTAAPTAAGTYTITATVTSGGAALDQKSASFKVQ